ncbi:MAG TPA: hypothetical protein QGG47_05955 [Acidobacteriota bacterium]|nr:hypothetical protein [Acidobacteriota bacterium]
MHRWTLFWAFVAVMTATTLWGLVAGGADEKTAGLLVRWTIRAAVVPFLLAFYASALRTLWPGHASDWLIDNRKFLGLAMAYGIAMNLVAIAWLASFDRGVYWGGLSVLDRVESYGGVAVAVAMTMTSFDRFSARLSPGAWRVLHTLGMYALWWVFFRTNALYSLAAVRRGLVAERWLYLLVTSLLIGALLLRMTAFIVRLRDGHDRVLPSEPALGR